MSAGVYNKLEQNIMGAGPTPGQVRYHMNKAKRIAAEFTQKHDIPCTPKLMRASNGEACIMYHIQGNYWGTPDQYLQQVQDDDHV